MAAWFRSLDMQYVSIIVGEVRAIPRSPAWVAHADESDPVSHARRWHPSLGRRAFMHQADRVDRKRRGAVQRPERRSHGVPAALRVNDQACR
jgi:hypothetical protein